MNWFALRISLVGAQWDAYGNLGPDNHQCTCQGEMLFLAGGAHCPASWEAATSPAVTHLLSLAPEASDTSRLHVARRPRSEVMADASATRTGGQVKSVPHHYG